VLSAHDTRATEAVERRVMSDMSVGLSICRSLSVCLSVVGAAKSSLAGADCLKLCCLFLFGNN
jgi:hypothetical protein